MSQAPEPLALNRTIPNLRTDSVRFAWFAIANILPLTSLLGISYLISGLLTAIIGNWFNLGDPNAVSVGESWRLTLLHTVIWSVAVSPIMLSLINNRRWHLIGWNTLQFIRYIFLNICHIIAIALLLSTRDGNLLFYAQLLIYIIIVLVLLVLWISLQFVLVGKKYPTSTQRFFLFILLLIIWLSGWWLHSNEVSGSSLVEYNTNPNDTALALLSFVLILITLISGPRELTNRLIAYRRYLLRIVRHPRDRARISSASIPLSGAVVRAYRWFTHLDVLSVGIFVLFGVSLYLALVESQRILNLKDPGFTSLSGAILLGILFFAGSLMIWLILNLIWRQRYLVLPLRPSDRSDAALVTLADVTTQALFEQLQKIGKLLALRQVEGVTPGANEVMSLFVSSGLEQQFMSELQSLVSLGDNSAPSASTSVWSVASRFVFTLSRFFAEITISGFIERNGNGEVEAVVELARRNRIILVTRKVVRRSNYDPTNESQLGRTAFALAAEIVLKLGQGSRFASRIDSLEAFLRGLEASQKRNWSLAVDSYQKATGIEEAERGSYAIGYYHIGTAMVLQGEISEGKRYLEIAEAQGLALAELQYMLALVSLYENWDSLDKNKTEFTQIERRCKEAKRLKATFPEVAHLLGAAYYQIGKLKNRTETRQYNLDSAPLRQRTMSTERAFVNQVPDHYRNAIRWLMIAIRQYELSYRRLMRYRRGAESFQIEGEHLFFQRITAAHKLADALRAAKRYTEAAVYYEDVLNVLPANITTLTDLAKTYCLVETWESAVTFLLERVMPLPDAEWDAHVHMHVGWALAGEISRSEPVIILLRSMQHINYALYQRPQYATRWEQTDWQNAFIKKYSMKLINRRYNPLLRGFYNTDLCDYLVTENDEETFLLCQLAWLGWQLHGYDYEEPDDPLIRLINGKSIDVNPAQLRPFFTTLTEELTLPFPDFSSIYHGMKTQRRLFAIFLKEDVQQGGRLNSLEQRLQRLRFGDASLQYWKAAHKSCHTWQGTDEKRIPFSERWCVDVYAECALFTVRTLAEGGAYETAYQVAKASTALLDKWIKRWQVAVKPARKVGKHSTFSPYVIRSQVATLYAWKAYCALQMQTDPETQVRCYSGGIQWKFSDDDIDSDIRRALKEQMRHPLALYTLALLLHRRGEQDAALDELHRLLTVIAPFNPNKQIVDTELASKFNRRERSDESKSNYPLETEIAWTKAERLEQIKDTSKKFLKLPIRERMTLQEQVRGARQFEAILNEASINRAIADIHSEQGRRDLAVQHLQEAITQSPYWDVDAELLLLLIGHLEQLNRFDEALVAIKTLTSFRQLLSDRTFSTTRIIDTRVWECIILSRLGRHPEALAAAQSLEQELKSEFHPSNSPDRYSRFKGQLHEILIHYTSRNFTLLSVSEKDLITAPYLKAIDDKEIDDQSAFTVALLECCRWITSPNLMGNALVDCRPVKLSNYPLFLNPEPLVIVRPDIAVPQFDLKFVMALRVTFSLIHDALRTLEHVCQIDNTIVFNLTQIGIIVPDDRNEKTLTIRIRQAQERMCDLLQIFQEFPELPNAARYRINLSNFYDTDAWRLFKGVPHPARNTAFTDRGDKIEKTNDRAFSYLKKLHIAVNLLDLAIFYNPKAAINHYHLARVYLRLLEYTWQGIPFHEIESKVAKAAEEISSYLSLALHAWQSARTHDTNDRLTENLGWLGRTITRYRSEWEHRHMETFGGKRRYYPSIPASDDEPSN